MNELTRAWNLLKPDERPVGMAYDPCFVTFWAELVSPDEKRELSDATARDRLIVAVEEVLLANRHRIGTMVGTYKWYRLGDYGDPMSQDPDRLAAANDALEAIRKDDDA